MKYGTQNLPSVIGPYKDSETNVRILFLEITEATDIQEIEWVNRPGDDSAPPLGSKILLIEIGDDWKLGIGCDDGIVPESLDGEKELYSSAKGNKLARVKMAIDGSIEIQSGTILPLQSSIILGIDGTIEVNGNVDNAVRYSKLETAYNELQDKFNKLIVKFTAHIHNDSLGSPTTTPTGSPPKTSTGDITLSKIDEVKLP